MYDYDFKINRLIKKINISNKSNTIQFKNYIVAYELEKNNLIKTLHDKTFHKGVNILYDVLKESKFWWQSMYEDVKNYHNIIFLIINLY